MLSGPSYEPHSGDVKKIVVFLHGFGSSGDDLITLAPVLAEGLPDTAFYSPNGVDITPNGFGYQWFSDADWTFRDLEGISDACALIENYIDSLCAQNNLTWQDVAIVGFSQGTMTALYSAPRFKEKLACVVGHSGRMFWHERLEDDTKGQFHTMPIRLIHGSEDDVVPFQMSEEACADLQDLGFKKVDCHIIPLLMHGIDEEAMGLCRDHLRKYLLNL